MKTTQSRRYRVLPVVCGITLLTSSLAVAADWSRFRGENGSGTSSDSSLPLSWSDTENLKWKAELPGPGFSSPIVVGDRVFVTCYSGYGVSRDNPGNIEDLKRHLICIKRSSGGILWSATVPAVQPEDPFVPPGTTTHGYASQTPTSDGEQVYVFFGKSGVFAYDMEGKQLWRTSVGTGSDPRKWGSAASLILYENLLIVNASAESAALIALDQATGEEAWRAEAEGIVQTWGTPVLVDGQNGTELVLAVPSEIWGFNPGTGKLKWHAAGSEARGMATSLVIGDGIAYCIGGMMGGSSVAVRTGGTGDVTDSHVVWKGRGYSQFGSAVLHQGYLYGADENGVAYCVHAETGKRVYQARLATGEAIAQEESGGRGGPGAEMRGGGRGRGGRSGGAGRGGRGGGGMGSRSYGSALLADGKVYFTEHTGQTHVFAANPEKYELLAKNQLGSGDGGFNSTPAISNGALLIRSNKFLYCVASE